MEWSKCYTPYKTQWTTNQITSVLAIHVYFCTYFFIRCFNIKFLRKSCVQFCDKCVLSFFSITILFNICNIPKEMLFYCFVYNQLLFIWQSTNVVSFNLMLVYSKQMKSTYQCSIILCFCMVWLCIPARKYSAALHLTDEGTKLCPIRKKLQFLMSSHIH